MAMKKVKIASRFNVSKYIDRLMQSKESLLFGNFLPKTVI